MSLQTTEAECAAIATAPRVTLADIEAAIDERMDFLASDAVYEAVPGVTRHAIDKLKVLSICILVMRNGFTIIGKSAPANFNAELGRKLAYEDAVRQLWPLMGYALRDKLAAG